MHSDKPVSSGTYNMHIDWEDDDNDNDDRDRKTTEDFWKDILVFKNLELSMSKAIHRAKDENAERLDGYGGIERYL